VAVVGAPSGVTVTISTARSVLGPQSTLRARVLETESGRSVEEGQAIEIRGAGALSDAPVSILASISREMVRLYKEQFGRGPTKVRTDWAGPDTIVSRLEDTLTPAEQNLAKFGEHQRVRDIRMFFQYATVREFCEPIERLTGRKVRAFLSAVDTQANGMAMETFVLYPEDYDGPSRADAAG